MIDCSFQEERLTTGGEDMGLARVLLCVATTVVLLAQPTTATPQEILPGVWRLQGIDPALADEDLAPLEGIVGDARVVALGESFHTSGGYYNLKFRVFKFLVEHLGFRAFAFETPFTSAGSVTDYVQTCSGQPEDALRGIFAVWQSSETRDLVRWMCAWNQDHPDDRVHFFGFDVQQGSADSIPFSSS